jgi:hypothetical protein
MDKLHRIFQRQDMPVEMVIEVIHHRRQGGGFAAARRPGNQNKPLSRRSNSGIAAGTSSMSSVGQVSGNRRSASDTPS